MLLKSFTNCISHGTRRNPTRSINIRASGQ